MLNNTCVVAIQSCTNGQFVCADNSGNNPLIANRSSINTWQQFDMIYLNPFTVTLRSHANGLFVGYENNGERLIANRKNANNWELFEILNNQEWYSFRSVKNKKFVCPKDNGRKSLVVNRSSASKWEKFNIIKLKNA